MYENRSNVAVCRHWRCVIVGLGSRATYIHTPQDETVIPLPRFSLPHKLHVSQLRNEDATMAEQKIATLSGEPLYQQWKRSLEDAVGARDISRNDWIVERCCATAIDSRAVLSYCNLSSCSESRISFDIWVGSIPVVTRTIDLVNCAPGPRIDWDAAALLACESE